MEKAYETLSEAKAAAAELSHHIESAAVYFDVNDHLYYVDNERNVDFLLSHKPLMEFTGWKVEAYIDGITTDAWARHIANKPPEYGSIRGF